MRIFGLMCQSVNLIWKTAVGSGVGAGAGGVFTYLLVTYKSNFQLNFGALLKLFNFITFSFWFGKLIEISENALGLQRFLLKNNTG